MPVPTWQISQDSPNRRSWPGRYCGKVPCGAEVHVRKAQDRSAQNFQGGATVSLISLHQRLSVLRYRNKHYSSCIWCSSKTSRCCTQRNTGTACERQTRVYQIGHYDEGYVYHAGFNAHSCIFVYRGNRKGPQFGTRSPSIGLSWESRLDTIRQGPNIRKWHSCHSTKWKDCIVLNQLSSPIQRGWWKPYHDWWSSNAWFKYCHSKERISQPNGHPIACQCCITSSGIVRQGFVPKFQDVRNLRAPESQMLRSCLLRRSQMSPFI